MSGPCRCREIDGLEGDAGRAYARDHLRLDRAAVDGWSARWHCEETGLRWRETYWPAWRASDPGERLDRIDEPVPVEAAPMPVTRRRRELVPRWAMAAVSVTLAVALLADSIQ